jgi:hypothetical protein
VLKSKHFNVVSSRSPFSHVAQLHDDPFNKVASLCSYSFMNCKIAPNFIEIGGITPAKLKEAAVAMSQVFRDSQDYSFEDKNE